MRLFEFLLFIALSILLNLAIFWTAADTGPEASGSTGRATITLAAASPSAQALVEIWSAPPTVAPPPEAPDVTEATAPLALTLPPSAHDQALKLFTPERADMAPPEEPADQPMVDPQVSPPPLAPKPEQKQEKKQPKAQKPRPASAAQPKTAASNGRQQQQAKGNAKGKNAGKSGKQVAAANDAGHKASAQKVWGAQIRAMIERNKRYPSSAKGQTGRVRVRITVAANGRLKGASVVRSSGVRPLDRAALKAIRQTKRYPKAPAGLGASSHSFNLTISFAQR
ncbi:energy transducer TonB [Thalassobius sp. Cn5-15]|uniref:cell envelope integrity protein TolA n=1 Tax=Thalassobius sp. Cn5-15 TaxID=2917763 RepID=UPI001EF1D9EA|nr:energy transducer TonB [Thalassobius sp. Cn5-15]MCG7494399.1 TonB family protein [Thalassobius sp. Cn5-15]